MSKSLPPGVQEKRKKTLGQICDPPLWVVKGPKYAGSNRVKVLAASTSFLCPTCSAIADTLAQSLACGTKLRKHDDEQTSRRRLES